MKTRSFLGVGIVACLFALGWSVASEPADSTPAVNQDDIKLEVRGIRVAAGDYKAYPELGPFSSGGSGTEIAVLATRSAEGEIVAFDEKEFHLDSLTDDQGKNLLPKSGGDSRRFPPWVRYSRDHKAAMVNFGTDGMAGKEASAIRLKARMVFKVATLKRTYRQKDVDLKPGTEIEAGPVPLTIKSVGRSTYNKDKFEVALQAEKDMTGIARIRFFDEQGEEIECSFGPPRTMRTGEATFSERVCLLARQVDRATVKVSFWRDLKAVEVPLDTTITLGLSP